MSSASQLEAIFFAALEKSSPAERAAYLDEACAGDAELRDRVERMLMAPSQAVGFLEQPATAFGTTANYETPISEQPGAVIGPYKLLQQIGEGGMGVVFMAEQTRPVKRLVALKIIKPGMDSRQVIARFEAERQALALMDHPNIARVLDAGTTGEGVRDQESGGKGREASSKLTPDSCLLTPALGRPYFVMELVKGTPITEYCDAHRLTPHERLELFASVCRAVHHAHQKGVIHRDVKPSNILVAEYDSRPVAKVIDFGVAKAVGQRLAEQTLFTQYGQVVGTFEYMSPEQAKLNQLDVDTRSDIYSLGVVLYELLAGSTPFDKARLRSAAIDEILRIVREEEPQRPSTRLSSSEARPAIAASRHTDPARLNRMLRGELDWIVMKCLEKERNRRYETANGLAHDIERYLNDEPVEASPPSAWYRFRKTVRRHKRTFAAVCAIASALVIGTLVSLYFAVKASERALEAQQNLTTARLEKQRADGSAKHAAAEREDARDSLVRSLYNQARATLAGGQEGRRWQALDLLERAEKLRSRERLGVPPRSADSSALPSQLDLRNEAVAALLTQDARLIREIQVSDTVNVIVANLGGGVPSRMAVSADGTLAAADWMPFDTLPPAVNDALDPSLKCLHVVDVANARALLRSTGNTHTRLCFALSAEGKRIAVAERAQSGVQVKIWAVPEFDEPQRTLSWAEAPASDRDDPSHQLVFSPNGKRLAYIRPGYKQIDVAIWDLNTGALKTFRQPQDPGANWGASVFTPDSRYLAIRTGRRKLLLWNVDAGESYREVVLADGFGAAPAFSPRGTLMAVAFDTTAEVRGVLWDYVENRERAPIRSGFHLSAVAFDPQGNYLAVGGEGGVVMVYDASNISEVLRIQGAIGGVSELRWAPDGRRLIWRNMMGTLQLWEINLATPQHAVPIEAGPAANLAFSPDGKWLGVGSRDGVRVVDRTAGETRYEKPVGGEVLFAPDSRQFAVIPLRDGPVVIVDLETGNELMSRPLDGTCRSAAFNQDGQLLVSLDVKHRTTWSNLEVLRRLVGAGDSGTTRVVLNVNTNEVVWQQPAAASGAYDHLILSPDGRLAASELRILNASRPFGPAELQATHVWEVPSGRKIAELETTGAATVFQFSPDHAFAASIGWSVPTFDSSADLAPSSNEVSSVIWSFPDGRRRFAMGPWPNVRAPLRFAFSPDSRLLAALRRDGVVEVWDVQRGTELFRVKLASEVVNATFTANSESLAWVGRTNVRGQPQEQVEYLDIPQLRRQLSAIALGW